jgi:hypothetical protein
VTLDARDLSYGCLADVHRTAPPVVAFLLGRFDGGLRSAVIRVVCADDARGGCPVRLTVAAYGAPAGHVTTHVRAGRFADVRIPYTKAAARRMARATKATLRFSATMRDARGVTRSDHRTGCVRPAKAQPTRC